MRALKSEIEFTHISQQRLSRSWLAVPNSCRRLLDPSYPNAVSVFSSLSAPYSRAFLTCTYLLQYRFGSMFEADWPTESQEVTKL
jgi:hypothetical protein